YIGVSNYFTSYIFYSFYTFFDKLLHVLSFFYFLSYDGIGAIKMLLISTMLPLCYLIFSLLMSVHWINDIACYFVYFLSFYFVTFIALIPGFVILFTLISLLWNKKEKKPCGAREEDVTILIPTYNAKHCIKETIESIKKQKYCGNIYVKIIDDG